MTNEKLTQMWTEEEQIETILYLLTLILHMSQSKKETTPEEEEEERDTDVSDEDAKE